MAREEKLIIRITEDVKNDFQALAETHGMTMSALGSYLIGSYISEHRHKRDLQEKLARESIQMVMNEQIPMILREQNRP